ncbi:MAG: hypothetical protein KIT83_09380 [Bryobacterales bacterium]|nr:hypothetical protein [Bryobacterales bacterium]
MILATSLRILAVLMLLLVGGEMMACEYADFSEFGHSHGTSPEPCGGGEHQCFCSCSHVLVTEFAESSSVEPVTSLPPARVCRGITMPPRSIYHPPRS